MAIDSTFITIELLIAMFGCLSLAYVCFLKIKIKKLTKLKRSKHKFEFAFDSTRVNKRASVDAESNSSAARVDELAELLGQQLRLSAKLKAVTSTSDSKCLSNGERQRLLLHIEEFEKFLQKFDGQVIPIRIEYGQTDRHFKRGINKVASQKLVTDTIDMKKSHREKLTIETQRLSNELIKKDKELKKIRVNSTLMSKELNELRADNSDTFELKQALDEVQQLLKRSEAERELLENNYVELEKSSQSNKELRDAIERLRAEYEMLEQRFIGPSDSDKR